MGKQKGWRPLTLDEQQEIIQRYQEDSETTLKALSEAYKRTPLTIRNVLTDAGVAIRNQTLNTPIELRLQDALKSAGIGFITQPLLLGRYLADILISQAPIVIEADGWQHNRPEVRAKDARRDAALAAAGYRTFRFTGTEINADAVRCIRSVIDACGLVPDKEPVFDIRLEFGGESHWHWKGGLREFTCDVCGEKFTAQPKHRPGPNYYCSSRCYGDAKRGKPQSPELIAKRAAGQTGIKRGALSAEAKAKMGAGVSAALKGRPKSPEHVAKVAAANRGKVRSPETRAKISATLKARNAKSDQDIVRAHVRA